MTRKESAMKNFETGYNCAQSVALAFSDKVPVDETTLLKLCASFGGGMGRLREVCGAVTGMFIVAGFLFGYSSPEAGDEKTEHYARIQELAARFKEKEKSIICRELLNTEGKDSPTPEKRTAAYYHDRPCRDLVGTAAEILDEFLKETTEK